MGSGGTLRPMTGVPRKNGEDTTDCGRRPCDLEVEAAMTGQARGLPAASGAGEVGKLLT